MIVAHAGGAGPGAWDIDPVVLLTAVVATATYARGVRLLRTRGSRRLPPPVRRWSFYLGVASATAAVVSPLHGWSEALFAAHMTQHLILILVSAPLTILGRPTAPIVACLPTMGRPVSRIRSALRRRAPYLAHPLSVWALHTAVLWTWHLPVLYALALRNSVAHGLEHATFIATAALLWAAVLGERPIGEGRSVLLLFATGLQSAALGAVLAFAGTVLYRPHEVGAPLAGYDALTDQQLAGVIMWIPPGILYLSVTAVMLARLLRDPAPAVEGAAGP